MSDAAPFQCLMAGLPETGKTTFLAALWHVAKSRELPESMQLERREGDQEYLNAIASSWSKCEELQRTPGEGEMDVAILLRDPANSAIVRISIPDMSGELFKTQWETRRCTAEFAKLLRNVGGCLLFLHPTRMVETVWIADANATLEGWLGEDDEAAVEGPDAPKVDPQSAEENAASPEIVVWEPSMAPTQVQMVELLQFFSELSRAQVKLAVIVSAWDELKGQDPKQWIEKRMPLLWQFLAANPDLYSVSYMGVSAQGGDRSDASLLHHETASHRIKVHAPGGTEHDITQPLRWLMSSESS